MEVEQEQRQHPLRIGQTWKLEHGYLQVVQLGMRLVHYRIVKQQDQPATTRLIGVVELLTFLKHNEAELVS